VRTRAPIRTRLRGASAHVVVQARGWVFPCEINPRFQNSTALLSFGLADTPGATPAPAPDAESLRLTPAAVAAIRWLRARVELHDAQPIAGGAQASPA